MAKPRLWPIMATARFRWWICRRIAWYPASWLVRVLNRWPTTSLFGFINLFLQKRSQPFIPGPAHGELRAIRQYGEAAVLRVRLDLFHALQVDNGGAVN